MFWSAPHWTVYGNSRRSAFDQVMMLGTTQLRELFKEEALHDFSITFKCVSSLQWSCKPEPDPDWGPSEAR